jgi:DNA modification methylase
MMLIRADARLLPLRDGCVQCVVTSPPYWGLRDYGDADQLGLEPTPEAYVASVLAVFAEVWRVLKPDGTLWLNLGDSYAAGMMTARELLGERSGGTLNGRLGYADNVCMSQRRAPVTDGLKPKDLIGIPWRVAFALQAAGWYLRSEIVWSKPNPMPESVTDRPTRAHEQIFLLAKSARYYYDAEAIQELGVEAEGITAAYRGTKTRALQLGREPSGNEKVGASWTYTGTRNKRSVWHVATQPYAEAHFATFPEALIEPCVLAGSRVGDLVCDPFLGSGTVGAVCERYGRRWVGTDLRYQDLAQQRTAQRGLPFREVLPCRPY